MNSPERTGLRSGGEVDRAPADSLIERGSSDRISLRTLLVPGFFIAASLLYLLGGLAWRQLHQSDYYDDKFEVQSARRIQIPAPRGHIYDRNHKLIVSNRPRYNIVADLSNPELRDKVHKTYLAMFRDARKKHEKDPANHPRPKGSVLMESARAQVLQDYLDELIRIMPGHHERVNASEISRHLREKIGLNYPLMRDIAPEEVAVFVENFPEEYPLQLYIDSVRKYLHGDSAAHVLGYLSNTDDLGENPDEDQKSAELKRIKYTGKTGITGLELEFNDELQGNPGSEIWRVKPTGYLDQKLSETQAQQGAHIHCSLDIDLQVAAEKALDKTNLHGTVIAIDIASGEILVMASNPRFDPNLFADKIPAKTYETLKEDGALYSIATRGVYPPGSTFKLVTAIAALRTGKLHPDDIFDCGKFFDIGGRLWPEHDGASFGQVDLVKMLRVSCNVYCYQVGLLIDHQPIADEAKRLGLDSKIDLGKVSTSRDLIVPDAKWKRDMKRGGWSSGDTANLSIGQGFLRTTPLNMAAMIASFAGNRTRTALSLIHDPSGKNRSIAQHGGTPLGLSDYNREKLVQGMRECITAGTGRPVNIPGMDIAGKTGTAEFTKKGVPVNLAWFEGFAPASNPEIAVLVMIEGRTGANVHGGANAGPVAKAVFEKWAEMKKTVGSVKR